MLQLEQSLFFWRDTQNHEIDFISYGPLGLFAFDIQKNSIILEEDLGAMKRFAEDFPIGKRYFLYGGDREYQQDGINFIQFEKGVKTLPKILGLNPEQLNLLQIT